MGRHGPSQEKKKSLTNRRWIEDEAHTKNTENEFETRYFSPESPIGSNRPPGIGTGSICCVVPPHNLPFPFTQARSVPFLFCSASSQNITSLVSVRIPQAEKSILLPLRVEGKGQQAFKIQSQTEASKRPFYWWNDLWAQLRVVTLL